MYFLYVLLFSLIYIYLFIAFDVVIQKIKIRKDFFFFCIFYSIFCFLALISYLGFKEYTLLYYIYESLFPLTTFFLLDIVINIQIDNKKIYNYVKKIFFVLSTILCVINVVFSIKTVENIHLDEAFMIYGLSFVSYKFYISSLYYFSIFTTIILLLFLLNAKLELKRDKQAIKILILTISLYCVYVFFINIIFPRLYNVYMLNSNTFISILPIFGIYYSIKKFDLSGTSISNLLIETLEHSPEGICLLHNKKIKYVNSKFYEIFFDDPDIDILHRDIYEFFPKSLCDANIEKNNIFSVKKPFSSQVINILCNKVTIPQTLSDDIIDIISVLNVSFLKDTRSKIEHINKNLESIIKESTKKLEDVTRELKIEREKRIDSENKKLLASTTDALTGLYNRDYFKQFAYNILSSSNPNLNKHLVIYLDLDNFKSINDTLGHSVGDIVLKEIAKRLEASVGKNNIISRIGGDEFLIFIKNEKSTPQYLIPVVANKILKNLRLPIKAGENIINTSISLGISIYPDSGKDIDTLIKHADIAMYNSKENGKNSYSVFEKDYQSLVKAEFDLTNDMIMAIKRNEFKMFYQPKVKIVNGKPVITGFESLIRWFHSTRGLIPPSEFIPIAERSGYISEIVMWVLDEVCKQIVIWRDRGKEFNISINFSSPKFEENHAYDNISKKLQEMKIDPGFIQLEISEKYLGKNINNAISTLNDIKNLGMQITIDDFGTEYSSLNYLKSLPIDCIKIDMEFTKGIGRNKKDEAIIIALIKLCENTDIDIIAEGVETKQQYEFLSSHGLKRMQGYYFYRPMPAEDIDRLRLL